MKKKKNNKVKKVMKEWKSGELHSGSKKGPIVKNQRQAIAIALSEQKKANKDGSKPKKSSKKSAKKDPKSKSVTVAKGVKVSRGKEEKMRERKGSSSAGKYKTVSPKEFAGAAGGASKYSFPINSLARARNALARKHFAPNPEGIERAVYRKYPQLKKNKLKREGKLKKKK
jgi:Family of unknown function (DUF6496)